ncbi:DNA starvation/stationary phase protection protein [Bacillus infantis]|uniref:Dps family protein n=1 Tax=Bacillus infantis TaxID=324767 RepID=UPI001CD34214|nr:Dps family protein [Bacillus infantis]MCA1041697.1 DNA starvation/stationary phase protection protein [Bacillus infantis]
MTLTNSLNKQIANWSVLYTKLHRFHWFVKGPAFFTLHGKFEELYNEAAANVDTIAERTLAAGGKPIAAMSQFLEQASIADNGSEETAEEMVASLISDYSMISKELKELTGLAEEENDPVTEDLAIGLIEDLEKKIWMLKAFIA